ncbi:hypothetical protein, partial [Paenibacillus sp. Aloe-11]
MVRDLVLYAIMLLLIVLISRLIRQTIIQRLLDQNRDLLSLLRIQPGFTFKLEKNGDEFYYRLLEGGLL